MELSEYIEQLLQLHDCVIVPEFGGFIANYKSATIDTNKQRIIPPSKSVLFNPNLITNDGLLGNAIADQQTIEYPEALQFITYKVKEWKTELEIGNRIEIGEIGFLFKEKGQIIFEQSRELNLLLTAYGLTSVRFVNFTEAKEVVKPAAVVPELTKPTVVEKESTVFIELNPEKSVENVQVAEQEDNVIPIQQGNSVRNRFKYLAVAAIIPMLFYSYWIPVETDFIDTGKIQVADFNPITKSPERAYRLRLTDFDLPESEEVKSWQELTGHLSSNVAVYNYQFDNELYIPIQLKDKTKVATANEFTEVNNGNAFHLISGCFSVKENAEIWIKDLKSKGYENAQILDFNGGLYRVTAGNYPNRTAAQSKLDSFKNNGFDGWILKQ